MDWLALHGYAEDVTLWTSLIINISIFLGAARIVFRWFFGLGQNWGEFARDIGIAWAGLAIIAIVYFGFGEVLIHAFHLH